MKALKTDLLFLTRAISEAGVTPCICDSAWISLLKGPRLIGVISLIEGKVIYRPCCTDQTSSNADVMTSPPILYSTEFVADINSEKEFECILKEIERS